MTLVSKSVYGTVTLTNPSSKSTTALYTVPAGKILILKEILAFCDSAGASLYVAKSGSAVIADTAANTSLIGRIAALATAGYMELTAELSSNTFTVVARNTVLEAGDVIYGHAHQAAANTAQVFAMLSGDLIAA